MKNFDPHLWTMSGALSRRSFIQGTAAVVSVSVAVGSFPALAEGAASEKFMKASQYLIQHKLSPAVGKRMEATLRKSEPGLDAALDAIIRTAESKNAKTVEEFFDAIPEGDAKKTAHAIIHGWYAGVIDASPKAEVFAYEEALMYQTTRDAMTIPTYAFSGPNNWTNVNPPVNAVPEF